ncbi:small nucleolar ribonucleoprotein complex subunit [Mytilinidion resinicola]|uniref:U three protein 7 n=1 Tax=Mytilinidion resinicola TaxID=574789 RepID=A0A6A6Y7J9_9PEZI|nr:small nucleolar ribonucleoprotein complex subunit [Mytilinidion resinicola]KAF2803954.1 small nucleolar ribonucleoprotein complex subunit [Mytilinidion resinicola]
MDITPSEPPAAPPARRKSKSINPAEAAEKEAIKKHTEDAQSTYGRGKNIRTRSVKDKKLRANLKSLETKYRDATLQAKNAEILLEHTSGFLEPEHALERTYKVRQDEIRQDVAIETAKKGFELKLEGLGPYDVCNYTRNGRELLIASRKGHVATMDWRSGKLGCELQLGETVRDAKWLHNNQSFAVAQKKHVYIYAHDGVELHRLAKHIEVTNMEFLPYHFLLCTASNSGVLRYTDTSTGQMVTELPTHLGPTTALCQNPWNGIMHLGHQKGAVTLWSPNSTSPLVKLLPNHGPVRALAVDRSGRYMVSTGQDRRMSVWDIRMFKEIHTHHLRQPGSTISISDRDLTAVGWGTQVSIFKPDLFTKAQDDFGLAPRPKVPSPYMQWGGEGHAISRVQYCPFEDVLGISHSSGFSSILVPGAGEPNYDALEFGTNPYETVKQRQEGEVRALLNKLQPEMISLDPSFIGNVDVASAEQKKKEKDLDAKPEDKITKLKERGRGRNSALRKHLRRRGQKNVIDEQKVRAQEAFESQKGREKERVKRLEVEYGPALARFARKGTM